uniref:GH92 family glycosyl hydrolase n=1 Tax=uncultured Draconibacterium sp. TaxID=1573823 RepID=UPI0032163220
MNLNQLKNKLLLTLFIFSFTACTVKDNAVDYTKYVDPLIGTHNSRWMLFPGPCLPFGMVKLSPDNTDEGAYKLGAGYEYNINSITGFGHVHSWMMGSFVTMPTTGEIKIAPGTAADPDSGYRSRINNDYTEASAGYYSVILEDYGIKAELTATTRGGFQRYTFPESESGQVLIDLQGTEEEPPAIVKAEITKISNTEVEGFVSRKAGEWNEYTLYFVACFNRPFTSMGGWEGTKILEKTDKIKVGEIEDLGVFLKFDLSKDQTVLLKTAISYVSCEQARLNLDTEMDKFDWSFEAVHQNAKDVWNNLLGTIKVEGGTESDKIKFYTNLYRTYSSRTIFSDVNGKYVDMCENVQKVEDFPVYGCDAFWGSFWNLNPLWSLATPKMYEDWVKSLLELYDRGAWLPDAPGGLEYSSIMVAAHQVPFIVTAWQKGIRGFDAEKAYKAVKEIQMNKGQPHECGGYVGNRNLDTYLRNGYIPANEGPVSNTLEYAYDDWCVAQMAKALGKTEDYKYFMQRSQYFRNVFDKSTGYVRPKYAGGPWSEEFVETKGAGNTGHSFGFGSKDYVEANAWQFSWFVPHDLKGLIDLMGADEFNTRLERGFENSRPYFATDFVNIGNQPNMEAPWLFNYSGKPWLTQYWVFEVLDNYFGTDPVNGYHGDEDQGQMGAFYVLGAIGLFQMDGGAAVDPAYELSGPLFERITIQLDQDYYSGKQFIIEAKNTSSKNRYIQSVKLNGKPLDKFWFKHSELVKGGKLVFEMGPEPNKTWAVNSPHPQVMDIEPIVATPYVFETEKVFSRETRVQLTCDTEGAQVYYTFDGSEPDKSSQLYTNPFKLTNSATLKMKAFKEEQESLPVVVEFKKRGQIKKVYMKDVKPGLTYNYTHGIYRVVNDFLSVPPLKKGIVPSFSIEPREKEQFFSFDYEGYISIPADGEYTFYLACNDGGRLYIDDYLLLNNDGLHPVVEIGKTVLLKAGLHPISVKYFQEGGRNGLSVSWEGPGIEKQVIPDRFLYH